MVVVSVQGSTATVAVDTDAESRPACLTETVVGTEMRVVGVVWKVGRGAYADATPAMSSAAVVFSAILGHLVMVQQVTAWVRCLVYPVGVCGWMACPFVDFSRLSHPV